MLSAGCPTGNQGAYEAMYNLVCCKTKRSKMEFY